MSSSTVEHLSHPKHSLILKEDDAITVDFKCYVCDKTVLGCLTYTCTNDHIDCQNFYLHKSCAELPTEVYHHKHNKHPLTLTPCFDRYYCYVCDTGEGMKFAYTCEFCDIDVCMVCVSEERVLDHEGHKEHTLTLMPRDTRFRCDACGEKDEDSSYVCTSCDFWIHKTCALLPSTIADPICHHHPLTLIYSIPDIHRYFDRFCVICGYLVHVSHWMYYCHKCTYFVHTTCATSSDADSMVFGIKADDEPNNEPDLVHFPLHSEESLFDLIRDQCGKLQVNFGANNNIVTSTIPNDPHTIREHWSHKEHPLEQFQYTICANDNDDNDDDDDGSALICDGCIQPITVSQPSYYACMKCGFFLHSFCATKLPKELPIGASTIDPQHSLLLQKKDKFYSLVTCGACGCSTNGFYYHCETCDIKIDICCAFLPARINHIFHKHHSLVQRPFSNSVCSLTRFKINNVVDYTCKTCSDFQMHVDCAIYPNSLKHKYDLHDITLRQPPFFYEGVFYCEICEEQVDNQVWLYHCGECDHSFHCECPRGFGNVKVGGTIELMISNQSHKLAFGFKWSRRKNSRRYICGYCRKGYKSGFVFECDGCGYLVCRICVVKILGE